ncbi:MAG: hypothetical protein ACRCY3_01310 [Sphingorhabdus sp.]
MAEVERERAKRLENTAPRTSQNSARQVARERVTPSSTPVTPVTADQPIASDPVDAIPAAVASATLPDAQAVPPSEPPMVETQNDTGNEPDENWLVAGGALAALGLAGAAFASRRRKHMPSAPADTALATTSHIDPEPNTTARRIMPAAQSTPIRDPIFDKSTPAQTVSGDPLFSYRPPTIPITDPLFSAKVDSPPITDPLFAHLPDYVGPASPRHDPVRTSAAQSKSIGLERERILEPAQ